MSKLVYRGVAYDSQDKPQNDHHHADGLRYRGAELDGEAAERDAQPIEAGHRKIYRGVVYPRTRH